MLYIHELIPLQRTLNSLQLDKQRMAYEFNHASTGNSYLQPDGEAFRSFMMEDDMDDDDMLPTIIRIDSNDIVYEPQQPHASLIADKYLKGEVLGDGSYSKVKEALDIQTLCRRAIKIVKFRNIRKIPNGYNNVKRYFKYMPCCKVVDGSDYLSTNYYNHLCIIIDHHMEFFAKIL